MVRSFAIADATAVLPFDFVRLPLIALIGYFVFGQALDIWTGVGAAVIIGASVYIAHRESVHQRAVALPPARPDAGPLPARTRLETGPAAK